jgi:hypothetical protein
MSTNAPRTEGGEETPTTTTAPDESDGLMENADAPDGVDAATPTRRRKGLAAVISVLFGLLLLLGAVTGYLDADAMSKCGECLRSVTASASLQNATYADRSLRAIAE